MPGRLKVFIATSLDGFIAGPGDDLSWLPAPEPESPAGDFGYGAFMAGIPSPLGIGTVKLEGGGTVKGFLCETAGLDGADEITAFGGWRAYVASLAK